MLKKMHRLFHPGSKRSLPYLVGVLFCGLLLAFAVTSKAAAYYPHDAGARPITATKMWQQPDPVTKDVLPAVQMAPIILALVVAVALLAAIARFVAWMQTVTVFSPAFELCYRRTHSIRPPPRS
jgi:sterol desaturase/sphingolipid hydroxylase (fatty acid hydroxylase superfamily)